jgi:hypothetical protein
MSTTERIQTQNQELDVALSRLGVQLRLGSDHNGAMLHRRLTEIAARLDEHLWDESRALYPRLEGSKHFMVREISKSARRQLQSMDQRVAAFLARWPVEKVDARHAAFVLEAAILVESLRQMLSGERDRLFPLVSQAAD